MRSPVVKFLDNFQQPTYNATMKNGHVETSKEKLYVDSEA